MRVITDHNDDLWFVLSDIYRALGISNTSKLPSRLDNDEQSNFKLRRRGNVIIVNESGLYAAILRNDKPEAKPFRKSVTNDVLPTIRKTGSYFAVHSITDEKTPLKRS